MTIWRHLLIGSQESTFIGRVLEELLDQFSINEAVITRSAAMPIAPIQDPIPKQKGKKK